MDKRVLFATVISMGLVLLYITFIAKPQPHEPAKPPATESSPTPKTANPATAQAAADATNGAGSGSAGNVGNDKTAGKPAAPTPTPTPSPTESTYEQAGLYRATFTSDGAAPTSWVLLKPQYTEDNPRKSNKQSEPIDLVRTRAPNLPLTVVLLKPGTPTKDQTNVPPAFVLTPDAHWTEQPRGSDGALSYVWENDELRVEKRLTPLPNNYQSNLLVTVVNKSDKPTSHFFQIQMHGWQDPNVKQGGMFSRRIVQNNGVCHVGGKLKKGSLDELLKKPIEELGDVSWIGIGEQYFLDAVALKHSDESKRCNVFGAADGSISSILSVAERRLQPQQKTEYEMAVFMGPKILSQLDAVQVAGAPAKLGDVIEWSLWGTTELLGRPMLAVLKAIHFVVPNWGVAIIVLTILLKAITWFPTQSSMKSMKAMAKLKPEMDKLKERYANDKNQLNLATMELYKKHGINPLGGCLPVLIQMPIYIALYSMLGNSVELYRSPFVGWIRDLTAADPYYVLPILTGVLMFVQQKTQPTPPDPQQKTMMYMMPVMFTAFSIFLPAGLTIYILTNTLLTFLQQYVMNRGDQSTRPKIATKPARA